MGSKSENEIARIQEMLLGAQGAFSEGLPSTTPDPLSGASIAPSAAAVTRGDPVRVVKVLSDHALVKFRENNAQEERVDSPTHNSRGQRIHQPVDGTENFRSGCGDVGRQ